MHCMFWIKQNKCICKMNDLRRDGEAILWRLYSYRSPARAIPQIPADATPDIKQAFHSVVFQTLSPSLARISEVMSFRDDLVNSLYEIMSDISLATSTDNQLLVSSEFYEALVKCLALVVEGDQMKQVKNGLTNDLSLFRRTLTALDLPIRDSPKYQQMSRFLATGDQFAGDLKRVLRERVPRFEELLLDMIMFTCDHIESGLDRGMKHDALKAIAFSIVLIDDKSDTLNILKRKNFKLGRVSKILKMNPIVPLFADMPLEISSILQNAPHFPLASLELSALEKAEVERRYSVLTHVESIQDIANRFYSMVAHGIELIELCNRVVVEQNAWKYLHPVGRTNDSDLDYELAIRHNYSGNEKEALIYILATCKSISRKLLSLPNTLLELLKKHVHYETQKFATLSCTEYIHSCLKRKREVLGLLELIPRICRDAGIPNCESIVHKFDEAIFSDFVFNGDSGTTAGDQLLAISVILGYCINEKSRGMKGGFLKDKDFKEHHVMEIRHLLDQAKNWNLVLDLPGAVNRFDKTSDLWFKEFYLEVSLKVQFPISTSLPWILTEYALESEDSELLKCVLYPFEIYAAASKRILLDMNCRYIHDELTAEVNLCFDRLIFSLSEKIYSHCKQYASLALIPNQCLWSGSLRSLEPLLPLTSFVPILSKTNHMLLGRTINIRDHIAQSMIEYLETSIDGAISRYEHGGVSNVLELKSLLECTQKTHELLSRWMTLEEFESILCRVNAEPTETPQGRLETHTGRILINDVIANCYYDSVLDGFVYFENQNHHHHLHLHNHLHKVGQQHLYGSKQITSLYKSINALEASHVGMKHLKAVLQLFRQSGTGDPIASLVPVFLEHLAKVMQESLFPQLETIHKSIPKYMSLPLFEYKTRGAFDYFEASLDALAKNPILLTMTLETLREIGNVIHLVRLFCKVENDSNTHGCEAFEGFLKSLRQLVQKFEMKEGDLGVDVYNRFCFHKVWGALQFLICVPNQLESLGARFQFCRESVSLAGTTLLLILNEHHLYKSFDFNSHMMYIRRSEWKQENPPHSECARSKIFNCKSLKYSGAEMIAGASLQNDILIFLEHSIAASRVQLEDAAFISLTFPK
ncbi:cytoplasmic fragile-X interacting family-domain-containing protein [Obelidium mucronatum]|nr:cytoplasmic fragile-X interacting family-domain-containing protein [Obelidium mucronatum]